MEDLLIILKVFAFCAVLMMTYVIALDRRPEEEMDLI